MDGHIEARADVFCDQARFGSDEHDARGRDGGGPSAAGPCRGGVPEGGESPATKAWIRSPDVREGGSPEEVERVEETDGKGDRWIKLGPVTVYRILEMR